MAQNHPCPSCSKKYAGFGGEDALKPVILPCLCRFCKGCALVEEDKAQQQPPAASGGKNGIGKAKEEQTPTPCMICKRLCKTPVDHLLLDAVLMKRVDSGHAAAAPAAPLCDMCEEDEATKYCNDCMKNKLFCDACFTTSHRKKQGHTLIPIEEHLASGSAHAAGGGSAAAASQVMCNTHPDEILKHFCETCNVLVCGSCGLYQHSGYTFASIEQAAGAHRETIESLLAEVVATREDAIAATNAVKIIRGELEGNKKAALQVADEGFNRLLRAIKQRRDELKALIISVYNEKDDMLNKQITALEAIDINSEAALQLIEDMLAAATSAELLERSQLFVKGLTQFTQHTVSLKEECASNIAITMEQSFEESAVTILVLGALDTGATDPAASTAVGEGWSTTSPRMSESAASARVFV